MNEQQIQSALANVCVQLANLPESVTALAEDRVYTVYRADIVDDTRPDSYPRAMVLLSAASFEEQISEQLAGEFIFNVRFQCRAPNVETAMEPNPHTQCLNFVRDFRRALYRHNPTLGGLVHTATIVGYETDGGAMYPDGLVDLFVKCAVQASFSEI